MMKYEVLFCEEADTKEFSDCITENKDFAEDRIKDLNERGYIARIKKVK